MTDIEQRDKEPRAETDGPTPPDLGLTNPRRHPFAVVPPPILATQRDFRIGQEKKLGEIEPY